MEERGGLWCKKFRLMRILAPFFAAEGTGACEVGETEGRRVDVDYEDCGFCWVM